MKDATYIKLKEGKLWASDQTEPKEKDYSGDQWKEADAMEAFNQSFVEVGNPEIIQEHLRLHFDGDGLHEVSGLQFEVRKEVATEKVKCSCICHRTIGVMHVVPCCNDGYADTPYFKKIAILSLKNEQPYRIEQPVEGGTLGTEFGAQEQPSEEKEGDVGEFLKRNGFNIIEENSYSNGLCNVVIEEDHYVLANNEGDTMYSPNLNIYWLIGALTYLGFMNKNYVD